MATTTRRETVDRRDKTLEPVGERHVLLVEDDDDMRRMLCVVLTRNGFRVTEARDGTEALEYLGSLFLADRRTRMPSLIITDQRMPGFCGLDVVEATRYSGVRVPAILITAFGDAETHDRARELGATSVLDKPFKMRELVSLAQRVARPAAA